MAQSAQIPVEIAGAKSLKTKVPAPVSAKGKWAELGEKELKDVLSAEKNDALRFLAIVKQCDDAEDWEMFAKAYRHAALNYLGIKPDAGTKTWPEAAKEAFKNRFEPRLQRIRRVGKAFEIEGKDYLITLFSQAEKKGVALTFKSLPKVGHQTGRKAKVQGGQTTSTAATANQAAPMDAPAATGAQAKKEAPYTPTFLHVMSGIEMCHEDNVPSLVVAVAKRLKASPAPEWQKLAKEMLAQFDVYNGRTGDAAVSEKREQRREQHQAAA